MNEPQLHPVWHQGLHRGFERCGDRVLWRGCSRTWREGLTANLARKPDGGDRDQVKAIAAGGCDSAIGNPRTTGQMMADPEQRAAAEAVRIVVPTFGGDGTHSRV